MTFQYGLEPVLIQRILAVNLNKLELSYKYQTLHDKSYNN